MLLLQAALPQRKGSLSASEYILFANQSCVFAESCLSSPTSLEKTNIKSGLLSALTYLIALSMMRNAPSKAVMCRRNILCDGNLLRDKNPRLNSSGLSRYRHHRFPRARDKNRFNEILPAQEICILPPAPPSLPPILTRLYTPFQTIQITFHLGEKTVMWIANRR